MCDLEKLRQESGEGTVRNTGHVVPRREHSLGTRPSKGRRIVLTLEALIRELAGAERGMLLSLDFTLFLATTELHVKHTS